MRRKSPEAARRPATTTRTRSESRSTSSRMWLREEDRPSVGRHRAQEVHHRQTLAWVHAVERLVEDQDRRIVHERGRHLDPLPHALRVAADRSPGGVTQLDHVDRAIGGRLGIGHPRQARRGDHELAAGEEVVHRLALGDEADATVHLRVTPGRRLIQLHARRRSGARKPDIMWRSVVLPAPFGPSRPVMPAATSKVTSLTATTLPYQRETPRQREHAHAVTRRYRTARIASETPSRMAVATP